MQRGDHLISPRTGYFHHGLYLGDQCVIHYSGYSNTSTEGVIACVSLAEFCQGNGCSVAHHPARAFDRETSIQRAYSRLGEREYHLALNNCEHFVNWCIDGEHASEQLDRFAEGVGVGLGMPRVLGTPPLIRTLSGLGGLTGYPAALPAGSVLSGLIAPLASPVVTTVVAGLAIGLGVRKVLGWLEEE